MDLLTEFLDGIENDPKFKEFERLERQSIKMQELENLIVQVSQAYGGDDPPFLKEYISDIIANSGIEEALACFRSLALQTSSVNNRR